MTAVGDAAGFFLILFFGSWFVRLTEATLGRRAATGLLALMMLGILVLTVHIVTTTVWVVHTT